LLDCAAVIAALVIPVAAGLVQLINALEGVVCQETDGAMYCFPRITLPASAIEAAKKKDKKPNKF
jgi:aspartate/methionine/tyrosine aminotransferase